VLDSVLVLLLLVGAEVLRSGGMYKVLLLPIGAIVELRFDEGLLGLTTMTARLLCEKGAGHTSIRVTKIKANASIKRQAYAIQGTEVRFFIGSQGGAAMAMASG
jgi:hypothetical protein